MLTDVNVAKEPLLRNMIADYLDTSNDGSGTYSLMGSGFKKVDEKPNAQEYEAFYINQSSSSSYVKGYKPEFEYDCDLMKGDAACTALYEVGRNHYTGAQAMFNYVRVDLFDDTGKDSTKGYPARKFVVTCIPDSTEGAGGDYIATTGTLKAVGDFVEGYFNVQTKAFSAKQ